MRILVTGSLGFIGSSLCEELLKRNHEVAGFDKYNPSYGVNVGYPMFYGDITYYHSIERAMKKVQPDAVINLAAYSTADPLGYEIWDETIDVNMKGSVNVAEASRNILGDRLQVFLQASTSEVYGNQVKFPITEDMELKPTGPYNIGKIGTEYYLRYLRNVFNFPVVILRNFNTYGLKPRRTVIERIIMQMLKGKECHLGNPDAARDFLYIDDHVNAYITCLEKRERAIGEVFNFCTQTVISIGNLATLIVKLTDYKGKVVWNTQPPRPFDINTLFGSYRKAKIILGWTPKVMLEEGLKRCVDHFREHPF